MSESTLSPDNTLMEAVQLIENSVKRLAVVLSKDKHVVGTLTDGDIRRCLLQGCTLETPVTEAMNQSPVVTSVEDNRYISSESPSWGYKAVPALTIKVRPSSAGIV